MSDPMPDPGDDDDPRIRRIARWAFAAGLVFAIVVASLALAPRAEPQTAEPPTPELLDGLPPGPYDVPSRQEVTLQEALLEAQQDGALWLRLRFVAPRIGSDPGQYGFDVVEWDMMRLCEDLGLPLAAETGAERIVVSFAASPIAFGTADPSVAQFFEVYSPENGDCIWEEF